MPLYYFHVGHEGGLVEDEEGIDLPDTAAAYAEAVRSAVEFLAETGDPDPMQLEITDTSGTLVLRASIHELAAAWQWAAGSPVQVLAPGFLH
jgi:hypothetical protein